MTSKEAIQKIDLTIKYGSMTQDEINSYLEYKKLIEKDLDVLEILKDKLDIVLYEDEKNNMYVMFLRFSKYGLTESFTVSKREYELLKERLENE